MKIFRRTSFVSISLVAAGCAAAVACSNDNDNSNGSDASSGGSTSDGGSGGTGATSSGGRSGGGSGGTVVSTGGGAGTGAGGLVITTDGGLTPGDSGSDSATDAGAVASFRVVHAAPAAGPVDIYVKGNSKPVATNIDYGAATPYLSLDAGSYVFELRKAGSTASSAPVFTTPSIDVAAGIHYTAVAEGNIASTDAADEFRVSALPETFAPATTGKARIRIVHASYDGPTVDLDLDNDDPKTPEVMGLKRFGDSGDAGVEVDADANVQVGVVVGGIPLTAFTTPKFAEGSDVFVIATGLTSKLAREATGLSALAVLPDSSTVLIRQNPRLYTLHVSLDAGPVDIFDGTKEAVDDSSFGGLGLVQTPPGAVTLDLFAAVAGPTARPVGAPVGSVTTPVLEAGNNYLGVIVGNVATATQTLTIDTIQEGFDLTKSTQALVRAVHASADTDTVDVGLVTTAGTLDTPPKFPALSFEDTSATAGASVPIGADTFGIAAAGTAATLAEFGVTTMAGGRSFAVVAGSATSNLHPLELFVVDTTGPFWSVTGVAKK